MLRSIKPEILDSLPHGHPAALRIRGELRLLNFLMGSHRWFARTLPRILGRGDSILEVGAGTGELGLALEPVIGPIPYAGIDLAPRPPGWPKNWRWWQTDLLDFQNYRGVTAITGNLILHQFTDVELAGLGRLFRREAGAIVFSEPARRRRHLWQLRLLGWLGLSPVGRHDARVSIEAGFRGDELPIALGLDPRLWRWSVRTGFRGYYRLVAIRRSKLERR